MLPTQGGESRGNSRRSGGEKFLNNTDLSRSPKEVKIIAVKGEPESPKGARVILKLALEGKTKFWYMDVKKDPNYKTLTDKFGFDENDWVGQKFLIHLEPHEFFDNDVRRITFSKAR